MKKIAAPWQFIDGYYHLDFGGEAQTETAAASTEQNDDDDDDETDDDGSSGIPPFRAQIRSRLVQASLYLQKRRQEQVDREEEESDNDDDENEKYSTNDEGTEIEDCILHHELCTEWAVRGECEANPGTSLSFHNIALAFGMV